MMPPRGGMIGARGEAVSLQRSLTRASGDALFPESVVEGGMHALARGSEVRQESQ